MIDPVTAIGVAAVTAANRAASKAIANIGSGLTKKISRLGRTAIDKLVVDFQIGFSEYFRTSYNKCRYFKTILNPNQPLEVLTNYVHLDVIINKTKIKDDTLIDRIPSLRHVVITGLAGSGKSMLMKYMTLCFFEGGNGTAPLFVEIRNVNQLTNRDLLTFIRTSCTSPSSSITKEQFELSLKSGALTLILDGFDELNHEYRDEMQKDILNVARAYPETVIIISSRPDERFGAWSSFQVLEVNALTKKQCLTLIKSLDYNEGVKRRFSRQVSAKLFASHTSFLTSPLLTTIMLLTYEQFAEIPDKMHAFYGQAFDTLFQKHDAQKEQYKRKTHTGLSRDDFRSCFAAFCALSYFEQKFSFKEGDLLKVTQGAIKYLRESRNVASKVTPKQVIDDLRESVCMLQPDGLELTFVHRSFQEYFTAVFIANVHGAKVKKLLDKCALRFSDSVIPMAYDMDKDTVEQEWVLPTLSEMEIVLDLKNPELGLAEPYSKMIPGLLLMPGPEGQFYLGIMDIRMDNWGRYQALLRLYPSDIMDIRFGKFITMRFPFKQILIPENEGKSHYDDFKRLIEGPAKKGTVSIKIGPSDDWWMKIIGFQEMGPLRLAFQKVRRDIEKRERSRMSILDEFV